ncbi:choice-of-anchor L domain-containing protein, partial [Flavobacterium sp.]|uniref:choice-of-anchor L domain-containing protein n=1 Tax=Flavobacterium sp. TaxID=239 RepID=UPI00263044A1
SEPISVTRSAITATSVTLGWTNTNAATEWQVLALPCGSPTPTASATGWVTTTTNPFVLNTLLPDTCYDFYVRAVCSTTDISDWTSAVSATTLQVPPACGGTFSDTGGSSGNYTNNSNVITTICPTIPGEVVTVTFTSFNTQATADGLYIFNGNSITAPLMSSGNPGGTVPGAVPGAYWGTANPGSFTSTSADGCLTFRFRSGAATNAAGWTSNVTCGPPPPCPQPQSLLTSTVTYNSVTLSWTENGTATAWQVLALPCGSPVPTASATGWVSAPTNPFVLSGLSSETCYDIYVRSECSVSELSTWIGPRTITTLIAPPLCGGPFVDNGGTFGLYLNNSDVTYTVCPVNAGDQVTVTFTSFNLQATADGLYVFDGNSIASEQISSGNPAGTVPGGLAGAYWGTTIPEPFTSTSPDGCLTFRFRSGAATNADGWVANVTCNPAPSCLRPNNVSVSAITTNSASVAWNETGTATTWHVLILPVGAPTPDATTPGWQTATTNPYIYTPLSSGTQYKVYVRSACSSSDFSLWSNPKIFNTLISNDECATATVAPVNTDSNCGLVVGGTVIGATASPQANSCGGTDDDDVWFQFTATATAHTVSLLDITGSTTDLFHVLYSGSCGTLTQVYCSDANTSLATALVVGQTYFIRVYTNTATGNQTSVFNLCVGTVPPPISTNTTTYNTFQLVEDVLLNSTCAAVTNVTSSTGTNFGSTNGIGYFNKNGSDFPFDEGVVLTTGSVVNVPGPNDTTLGEGTTAWTGDADLEAIILAATGAAMNSRNASKLEFDFTPLSDSISFRFIFASEEYGTFQCSFSDAFAFLLTDITPGVTPVTTNLALIPGTSTPISVVTIRDALYNTGCASVNPEYFAAFYGAAGGFGPFAAPIDYNGVTVPMTAAATVIPGHQYHIKLVVADRSDTAYDSVVFLEGGSFDIGNVELGDDFLEANGTALCPGDAYIIQSDLDADDYTFQWSNASGIISGQTGPNLTITEEGTYSVSANFIGTTCIANDSVTIEYYEGFTAGTPVNLTACNNMMYNEFDLSQNTANALGTLNASNYTVTYHATLEDAQDDVNILPTLYTNTTPSLQTVYVRVESNLTGCNVISPFNLVVQDLTPQFIITPDLTFCAGTTGTITVTPLNYSNADVTFSWSLDGSPLPDTTSSITITTAGVYEVVVNNSGCIASDSTTASITPIPVPDAPANVVACDSYTLPALTTGNYYTGSNGTGTMLSAGNTILLP